MARDHPPLFPSFFTYKVVPVLDSPDANLRTRFPDCIAFIKQAIAKGGKVLVHCFAGVSRSAAVVIAYLMQEHGLSVQAAYGLVRSKRPYIKPNEGFHEQLIQFQRELRSGEDAENKESKATLKLSSLIRETLSLEGITSLPQFSKGPASKLPRAAIPSFEAKAPLHVRSFQSSVMPPPPFEPLAPEPEQPKEEPVYSTTAHVKEPEELVDP